MKTNSLRHALWAVPTVLALAACGGGSGSQEPARVVASADAFKGNWNATTSLPVLSNDSSSAGALQLTAVGTPGHGQADIAGDHIAYTPSAGYFGTDQFTYTVSNGAASSTATVTVQVSATLALKGRAYDAPLAGATVKAVVGGVAYTTTADADGYYSLPIEATAPDQFVDLTATGVGKQAHVKLTSLVGEAAGVAAAVNADGHVPAEAVGGLNVTNVSTAQAALATAANGGVVPTTQAALTAANAQVQPEQMLQMAAVIKLVADEGVPLPKGVTDTAQLVQAADKYQRFAQSQAVSNSAAFSAAQQRIASDPFFAVAPAPVAAPTTRVFFNGKGCCTTDATAVTLRPDGSATLITSYWGRIEGKWSAAAGVTRFVPNAEPVGDVAVFSEGEFNQFTYSAQQHLVEVAWRQVGGDASRATVSTWTTGHYSYTPVNGAPAKADLPFGGPDTATMSRLDDFATLSVPSVTELTSQPLAGIPTVPAADDLWTGFSQDVAVFNADGSGALQRTGSVFTWTRSDRELVLSFGDGLRMVASRAFSRADGEQRWLVRYDRPSASGWVASEFLEAMVVPVDPGLAFTAADLAGIWRSSVNAGVVSDEAFYLQLDASQSGNGFTRYLDGSPDASNGTFTWRIEDGRVVMSNDRGAADNAREWTKLHQSGQTLFVLERRLIGKGYDQWRINRYDLTKL